MSESRVMSTRDAIGLAYQSYNQAKPWIAPGPDRSVRHPEWTGALLNLLGRPDVGQYNVAVTGSKGKGSHAILLAAILEQCGLRTGLFTGPHLVDFMERFRINGDAIQEHQFVSYMQRVHSAATGLRIPQGQYIGPIGVLAVAASLWFRDQATDVNVFELGRGALYDDVNQVVHQGAVVTPVFLEHVRELGPTLNDVAVEKSAVLTGVTWAVSAAQEAQVLAQLTAQSERSQARLRVLGEHFEYQREAVGNHESVTLTYPEGTYVIELPRTDSRTPVNPMLAANTAVAFDAARQVLAELRPGYQMPYYLDLGELVLPGRLQVLQDRPLVVVDGTIHAKSARFVLDWARAVKTAGIVQQLGLVAAIPADKDGEGVLRVLGEVVDFVILARARNPHLYFDGQLAKSASRYFSSVVEREYLEDAIRLAHERLGKEDGLLLLGTQSFVGDALRVFDYPTRSIWRQSTTWEGIRR